MDGAIDWITERMLQALARDEAIIPQTLTFLLRRYAVTGRRDLDDALGPALARALDRCAAPDLKIGPTRDPIQAEVTGDHGAGPTIRSGLHLSDWLALFVEAAGLSDDERLWSAVGVLVTALEDGWPGRGDVTPALRSVDACLSAARLEEVHANTPAAIDELERIIGSVYLPGDGLARTIGAPSREPGSLNDHAAAASALLTAYGVAGRLPYSMLAEELMQFARRTWWDDARGGFHGSVTPEPRTSNSEPRTENREPRTQNPELFLANCEAARVLCRLAALHRDPDYRKAAVIAEQSDYADDATRTLESLTQQYRAIGLDAAIYGLALTEVEALR